MQTRCSCGASGNQLLPDFAYEPNGRTPMMAWRGGRIGDHRVAVEDARAGVTACPACEERACVYMPVSDDPFHRELA